MSRRLLPTGFIVPAQPVERAALATGAGWVPEIKHDGYRIIVRRDGDYVRLYSRKANNWTARLSAIVQGATALKAKSFAIDGEAVVIGENGPNLVSRRGVCPLVGWCLGYSSLDSLKSRSSRGCAGAGPDSAFR